MEGPIGRRGRRERKRERERVRRMEQSRVDAQCNGRLRIDADNPMLFRRLAPTARERDRSGLGHVVVHLSKRDQAALPIVPLSVRLRSSQAIDVDSEAYCTAVRQSLQSIDFHHKANPLPRPGALPLGAQRVNLLARSSLLLSVCDEMMSCRCAEGARVDGRESKVWLAMDVKDDRCISNADRPLLLSSPQQCNQYHCKNCEDHAEVTCSLLPFHAYRRVATLLSALALRHRVDTAS
ncbi:hypothetical protein K431DRAFT_53740 [Polychaeton citri CBS 116435]|uniref:Uncharacterized protein n=1 Tax=Polychaeton citri CBS 116435 TaxID=1314669 RepID=A0A9P4QHF3_9PEZI|nr:hypothetical protein K431DRAFT_53740 [Polychaeton citri CBS 116435]